MDWSSNPLSNNIGHRIYHTACIYSQYETIRNSGGDYNPKKLTAQTRNLAPWKRRFRTWTSWKPQKGSFECESTMICSPVFPVSKPLLFYFKAFQDLQNLGKNVGFSGLYKGLTCIVSYMCSIKPHQSTQRGGCSGRRDRNWNSQSAKLSVNFPSATSLTKYGLALTLLYGRKLLGG